MLKLPTLLKLSFSQSNYFYLCTFTICVSVSSWSPALLLAYIMSAALLNVNGKIYLVKHRLSDAEMCECSDTLNASLCRIRPRPRPTRLRLVNSWWRRWTHHCRGFQLSQPCQQKSRRCQSPFSEYPWRTRHAYLISFCVCPIRWKNLELGWIYMHNWRSFALQHENLIHPAGQPSIESIWAAILELHYIPSV